MCHDHCPISERAILFFVIPLFNVCVCAFQIFPCSAKVEAGGLERSYRRAPRSAKEGANAKCMAGICHFCLAGYNGLEWEDMLLEGDNQCFSQLALKIIILL